MHWYRDLTRCCGIKKKSFLFMSEISQVFFLFFFARRLYLVFFTRSLTLLISKF